jgi:hypothetical protein
MALEALEANDKLINGRRHFAPRFWRAPTGRVLLRLF